jgi:hypothetical protein
MVVSLAEREVRTRSARSDSFEPRRQVRAGVAAVGTRNAGPWAVRQRWLRVVGRTLSSASLVIGAGGLWVLSGGAFRMLCLAAIVAFAACSVAYAVNGSPRPLIVSGLIVAFLLVSPVEVSSVQRSGPPGVVALEMGLPGPRLKERAKRGEVVLGGCIVGGLEPRWVVIW